MLTRTFRPLPISPFKPLKPLSHQTRTFLPFPFPSPPSSAPQTLTATATLPYPSAPLYTIISDISSYSLYLPYCTSSTVTSWSSPDSTYNRRWPSSGHLKIGYKNLTESFTSRVYCVPGRIVESVGGTTKTSLPEGEIAHHLQGDGAQRSDGDEASGLLSHLRSRWTLDPQAKDSTRVTLALEYAFTNPIYTALSAGAVPMVADIMVKAFEERARAMLEHDAEMRNASLDEFEESRLKKRGTP